MGQKVLGGDAIMSLDFRVLNWLETRMNELIQEGVPEDKAEEQAYEELEPWG